jgi:hypothetical protein
MMPRYREFRATSLKTTRVLSSTPEPTTVQL